MSDLFEDLDIFAEPLVAQATTIQGSIDHTTELVATVERETKLQGVVDMHTIIPGLVDDATRIEGQMYGIRFGSWQAEQDWIKQGKPPQ
jgi:hypothetical protein